MNSDCNSAIQIPSSDNFNEYFKEFHKMFIHCKYNLVALNKKFESLESFFKKFVMKDEEVCSSNARNFNFKSFEPEKESDSYSSRRHSISRENKISKIETNKKSNRKTANKSINDDENENFPISLEDLEFLTKNYISESKDCPSTSKKLKNNKKLKSPYDIIVINKTKMTVDNHYDFENNFDSDKEILKKGKDDQNEKEEIKVQQIDFKEKLFDYKNFNSNNNNFVSNLVINNQTNLVVNKDNKDNINLNKSSDYNSNANTDNNNINNINQSSTYSINKNIDTSKWLTKHSQEAKDILSSNDQINLNRMISDNLSLSLVEIPAKNLAIDNNLISNNKNITENNNLESTDSNIAIDTINDKKQTKISEFLKIKKENLAKNPKMFDKKYENISENQNLIYESKI
jgi:hypothetical protein